MSKALQYQRWLARRREFVTELKRKPCLDCAGTFPPECMDFDHRDPDQKVAEISDIISKVGLERLLAEIAKCDLVCANCHRIRTKNQTDKVRKIAEIERLKRAAEECALDVENFKRSL